MFCWRADVETYIRKEDSEEKNPGDSKRNAKNSKFAKGQSQSNDQAIDQNIMRDAILRK